MFLLAGISSKVKKIGRAKSCLCPACGQSARMHIVHAYNTPHVFFVPTFAFNSDYIATCPLCASVMEISKEKGRELVCDIDDVRLYPEDMTVRQNNNLPACQSCGARLSGSPRYCPDCGSPQ